MSITLIPQQLFFASSISDSTILVNDESANLIQSETKVTASPRNSTTEPQVSNLDYSYLIPDLELRKYINERGLRKTGDEIETYNATVADLETITYLDINRPSGEMLAFESLEGMEYLTNVRTLRLLRVSIPESGLENISHMTSLTVLTLNDMFFSGTDGTLRRYNISINGGEVQEEAYLPFDQYVDFSPLAKLTNVTDLYLTHIGMQQDGPYSYSNRTHGDISSLGAMTNLRWLDLQTLASVDDPSFSFLENLTNLTELSLIHTPLNDVTAISTLPQLTKLNISGTFVTDFTPIIDKVYFTGATEMKIRFPISYYDTRDVDGEAVDVVSIDSGINLGAEPTSVGYTTVSSHVGYFGIFDQTYDETLKIEFNLNDLKEYGLLNWETGQYDQRKLGFVWGAKITTENGKSITYSINTMEIGKKVIFDANHEGGDSFELLVEPFALIEEPTIANKERTVLKFGRDGYELTGWSLDKEGQEPFDFASEQHKNITLYANWQEKAVDPVDPVEPVDPTEPVDPVEPTDPVEPIAPTNPGSKLELAETGNNPLVYYSVLLLVVVLFTKFMSRFVKSN